MRARLAETLRPSLFFAGEATHAEFFSTAHGAYMSGVDAAKGVARKLAPKKRAAKV